MRTNGLSTLNFSLLLRASVRSAQLGLAAAQVEVASGRHYDMGLALGGRTEIDIRWRSQLDALQHMMDNTKFAASRAELMQGALDSVSKLASSFMETLSGTRGAADGQVIAHNAAGAALNALTDLMNTTYGGEFIFGGTNSGLPALSSFSGGSAEAAANDAFLAFFGFAPSSSSASGISAGSMKNFLDGSFASLFDASAWAANWSVASPEGVGTRLGRDQVVDASSNPAKAGATQLAEALTMTFALGEGNLSPSAFQEIVDKALGLISKSQQLLGQEQTRIGLVQEQISSAISRMTAQSTVLTTSIAALEAVDPYEAATRVNNLMNQLELSYTITSKLGGLSLVKFI